MGDWGPPGHVCEHYFQEGIAGLNVVAGSDTALEVDSENEGPNENPNAESSRDVPQPVPEQ